MAKVKKKIRLKPVSLSRTKAPAVKRDRPAKKVKVSRPERKEKEKVAKSNGATPKPSAPPKPLTPEMIQIRSRLLGMLSQVRKDIDSEVRGAGDRDLAHINDTSDMASDAAEGDLALRIAESETAEASEIERAIEKIDTGTYGSCEMCNKPIGADRLQFLPYVTLCIKCQELAEIRKREEGDELDDLNAEGGESDEG